ncbi:hypothetical protein ACFZA2_10195 [Microbacterium sp. NPDC007973]|uniref:hypothetical protein n=1 Tax=Microbacterium sp. NPDC007973 TaxID=3364182 RepID=UPI0036E1F2B6
MSRVLIRPPKPLTRRPYRARRAPQHENAVTAVLEVTPVPRGIVTLVGVMGAAVVVELIVGLAVIW